ncbi:T9SS type A sorting domain-containing protein [Phnomibacter ginsenosidimutans]|uniref:T9SS type A sorting domain-containing protein n=1 Tax=Phnomibacter ginsenosidimutans TaxID=2676868 RepID=A0A6I6G676_9BACT|nr:T9SS type A sorting domain-containing protein [Phnomibacter ginsenosidimutans]QGW27747.1 T9SS type A sorting domain-containing protein [Phnomibacter ginsenosidimutans]
MWYTTDITAASPTWIKVNDFFDNIAVTSFAQNASNPAVMYFGTGEGWFNGDAIEGLGIWKSTNGGTTWTRLTSTGNFAYVQDLQLDNSGNLYASLRNRTVTQAVGIQKSVDGGASWTQVLGAPVQGPNSRGADLELAANGDMYASIGFFATGRVYRSAQSIHGINTGNVGTWEDITPDPSTNVVPIASATDAYDRIELAVSPSSSNLLYAIFEGNGTQNAAYIKQYDANTNTWTSKSVPTIIDQGSNSNFTRGQAWYDLIAAVDPLNSNSLYIGGVDALRSDNAGSSWSQKTTWSLFAATGYTTAQNVHADHHALTYAPGSSSRMVLGTDGGIDYTADADNTTVGVFPTFARKNTGYNVTQFYAVANHPTNPNFFLAGAQDNGSHRFTAAGMNSTTQVTGGDGAFCHIDQNEPNIMITSYVYNNYYVSTNGGTSFSNRFKANTGGFINPTDYDDYANILYGGNSAGTYFRYLNPATDGATNNVAVSNFGSGSVTHVSVSPSISNRVYFGTNNGRVVAVDAANTGTSKTGTLVWNSGIAGSVSCIAIDPSNEQHMLVTFSNYGVNSVWETNNGGASWTSVEGNLPDMPVRWAVFDPRNSDHALLATEMGVWSTDNLNGTSTAWDPTNTGLANVRVNMLQYTHGTGVLSAATHGRGLYTAQVPARTTPDVNFQFAKAVMTEATTGFADCRSYTDYTVFLTISKAPVGDANVTVQVGAGTTATEGQDFQISTNGSFATPSKNTVFLSGSSSSKAITVRVFNDAQIEGEEVINLTYSLSGSTDAATGLSAQTVSIVIPDDDALPSAGGITTVTAGIYEATFTQPFRGDFTDAKTQMIYTAAELRALGLGAGTITQLGFEITAKNSLGAYENFRLSMKQVSLESFNGNVALQTGLTTVFSTPNYYSQAGINDFMLQTPFAWDGVSNILVEMCFDNDLANPAAGGGADPVKTEITSTSNDASPAIMAIWKRENGNSCDGLTSSGTLYTGAGTSYYRPVMRFRGASSGSVNIAAAVNTNNTYYFGPFADIYIYNSTGSEIMARLRNLSAHDYGCTVVNIDRAGTTSKAFWNNTTANHLFDKTFTVTPTNNNASGSYEITLYYTDAEVQGWQTATGQSWNSSMMVKTTSPISSYTAGSVPVNQVEVNASPVRGTFGTGRTIMAQFNTGFSGFGVGVPDATLPVTWLDVQAKGNSDHNLISWTVGSEQNNNRFDVQISRDGNSYTTMGSIRSRGNTNSSRVYNFKHIKPQAGINYYRILQVDADGKSSMSKVVSVRSTATSNARPFVFPTVATSSITLNMGELVTKPVQWELFSSDMRLMKRSASISNFVQTGIDVSTLPAGTYFLRINKDGKQESLKFVKQ